MTDPATKPPTLGERYFRDLTPTLTEKSHDAWTKTITFSLGGTLIHEWTIPDTDPSDVANPFHLIQYQTGMMMKVVRYLSDLPADTDMNEVTPDDS